jgi:uncharacterized protein YeaO (DUF488 family)
VPIKTKRWNDPQEADDGFRLLVCRYRPRGVRKQDETWHTWCKDLGPSRELHGAFYGKHGDPIDWDTYRRRYLEEVQAQADYLDQLASLVAEGKTVTLLCSSACTDAGRCHRTLLRELIEQRLRARA